jgi:hypothetical protein
LPLGSYELASSGADPALTSVHLAPTPLSRLSLPLHPAAPFLFANEDMKGKEPYKEGIKYKDRYKSKCFAAQFTLFG